MGIFKQSAIGTSQHDGHPPNAQIFANDPLSASDVLNIHSDGCSICHVPKATLMRCGGSSLRVKSCHLEGIQNFRQAQKTCMVEIFHGIRFSNSDVKVFQVKVWIGNAHYFFIGFDNFLDIHFDEVVE